jgi:hypothetical protein
MGVASALMRGPGLTLRLATGALAGAGVVIAHCGTLVLVGDRPVLVGVELHGVAHLLRSGEHGLGIGIGLALGLFVAGLVALPVARLWKPAAAVAHELGMYRYAASRLAVFQVLGFLLMEGAEFWLLNGHLAHFHEGPALLLGIAAQVVVALAGALLLVAMTAVGSFVRRRATLPSDSEEQRPVPISRLAPPRFAVARGGASWRGPPPLPA